MRLVIAAVGRLKKGPEFELILQYQDRLTSLGRSIGMGPLSIVEVNPSGRADLPQRRDEEAKALCGKIADDSVLIAMQENGRRRASGDFARHLGDLRDNGVRELVFAIGGADGLGQAIQDIARENMSLSPLTFPHILARLILTEQLYRAVSILAGHPYHRQ